DHVRSPPNCLLLREPAELADRLATCATPHSAAIRPGAPRGRCWVLRPPATNGSAIRLLCLPSSTQKRRFLQLSRSCIASCKRAVGISALARSATTQTKPLNSPTPMREKAPETYDEKLGRLQELRYEAIHASSEAAVAKQHERGKYTARERVEKLLD